MSSLFLSYSICFSKDKVKSVSESFFFIAGRENIPIVHSLSLFSVLHVFNYKLNLLSISHITKTPMSKNMLGRDHEEGGLSYYILCYNGLPTTAIAAYAAD